MAALTSKLTSKQPAWVAALVACLALAGCSAEVNIGSSSEATGEEIAGEIKDAYAEQTGIELTGLTCEGVDESVGERFECSGRNERGVQLEISGKVTDTAGAGFDYSWNVSRAIAPGVFYERALRRDLEESGIGLAEVRCPVDVEVEVGAEVRCKATDRNGVARTVTLRLTDTDGGFDYSVEGEGPADDSPAS